MMIFIATAVVFALAMAGMAIGVLISNRRLKGSCGGLAGLDPESPCQSCGVRVADCPQPAPDPNVVK